MYPISYDSIYLATKDKHREHNGTPDAESLLLTSSPFIFKLNSTACSGRKMSFEIYMYIKKYIGLVVLE